MIGKAIADQLTYVTGRVRFASAKTQHEDSELHFALGNLYGCVGSAARLLESLQREKSALEARVAELEGGAAWIITWMTAEKYRKPDIPEWVKKAQRHYKETLERAEKAEAELAAARKDAERYRWLRLPPIDRGRETFHSRVCEVCSEQGEELDAAIDALAAKGEK